MFVSGELLGSGLHICEFLCERHFGFTHKLMSSRHSCGSCAAAFFNLANALVCC